MVEEERDSSQEGGEESSRVMDKAQQGLNHVGENPTLMVKKPYINQAQLGDLYSDDMPNVTFHLTTPELLETTQRPSQRPSGKTILPFKRNPINSINISQLLDHMRNTQEKLLNEVSRHLVDKADSLAHNRDSRQSLKAEPLSDSWTVGCHLVNDI